MRYLKLDGPVTRVLNSSMVPIFVHRIHGKCHPSGIIALFYWFVYRHLSISDVRKILYVRSIWPLTPKEI